MKNRFANLGMTWPALCLLMFGTIRAASITDAVRPVAPGLTVSVLREHSLVPVNSYCIGSPQPLECRIVYETVFPQVPDGVPVGIDSVGNLYQTTNLEGSYLSFAYRAMGNTLERVTPAGSSEVVAQLWIDFCTDDPLVCNVAAHVTYLPSFQFDVNAGRILMAVRISEIQGSVIDDRVGIVALSGLPNLFDTFLTFLPGGGALSALTPAHPDGFRSADSLQLWAGDVATLPDWSQAQAVACPAASTPVAGQVVSIADPLSDPLVGHGRYYLTASMNGPDRRLGRQWAGGQFSARNPSALPVCAPLVLDSHFSTEESHANNRDLVNSHHRDALVFRRLSAAVIAAGGQ